LIHSDRVVESFPRLLRVKTESPESGSRQRRPRYRSGARSNPRDDLGGGQGSSQQGQIGDVKELVILLSADLDIQRNMRSGGVPRSTTNSVPTIYNQVATQPQMADDDHHAEEQDQGVEVDGCYRALEADRSADDHERGANNCHAGPVEAQERDAAGRDRRVGGDEDEGCDGLLVDADQIGARTGTHRGPAPQLDQLEEFHAGACVGTEGSQHRTGDRERVLLLHAAHRHAEMRGLDDHRHAKRGDLLLDRLGDLARQTLLDLQPAAENIHEPGNFTEANHLITG